MQKELSTDTSGPTNSYEGPSPELTTYNPPAATDEKLVQLTPSAGAAYAELPIDNATTQDKSQDDENPATQPETHDESLDASQNNRQATPSKGWVSTLAAVPSKIVSVLNPFNWRSSKNAPTEQEQPTTEQQKIIVEETYVNNEEQNLDHQGNNSSSDLDKLTPDDSEFKDDTSITGDDSNLQNN